MHHQIEWNSSLESDVRRLTRLAMEEDLGREQDWTTLALVPDDAIAVAQVVSRTAGVIAGLCCGPLILDEIDTSASWETFVEDGTTILPGTIVARIAGPARDLLTVERTVLNFLGHLGGIATLTAHFVHAVAGTKATICDTRKTLPGWRRLEKYAVRRGGGLNHRGGLYDGILIKDNHLAFGAGSPGEARFDVVEALERTRQFLQDGLTPPRQLIVQVEIDSLLQLQPVLAHRPDIVLLDNMSPAQLTEAVAMRNQISPSVLLEASGGITLANVRDTAVSGVDRISIGALTHSAPNLDVALDWSRA